MSFTSCPDIQSLVQQMVVSDLWRGQNRANINMLYNGFPPYTPQEQIDNRIDFNVPTLAGTRIIAAARQTWNNAFQRPTRYFDAVATTGPVFKRQEWSEIVSKQAARVMKRSMAYTNYLESKFGAAVLHGIGIGVWPREGSWCPQAKGPEDVLVPDNTLTSLENLPYFAIRMIMTAPELTKLKKGNVDKGWNQGMLNNIVAKLSEQTMLNSPGTPFNWWQSPEKAAEFLKENPGYLAGQQAPTVLCWDFYYLDDDSGEWRRRIIVDPSSAGIQGMEVNTEFLFDPKDRNYGKTVNHIMHVLFSDGCVVAPFRWHSVRSLGYLMYPMCHANNRKYSKLQDATMDSMMWLFRSQPDGDEERLERVDLHNMGIVPNGLTWVLPQERMQINIPLLQMSFGMDRQLMAESAASFVQDPNDGTQKEMTATETMARMNQANALVGSMLTRGYVYMTVEYREIFRRLCTLEADDCKAFRERCVAEGVDPAMFDDPDAWDINPVKTAGDGNRVLQIAMADKEMEQYDRLDPEGRRIVLHDYYVATTGDPEKAERIAKLTEPDISSAVEKATLSWATLMDGKQVQLTRGFNVIEYVQTLLEMLVEDVAMANQNGGMVPPEKVAGYANVIQNLKGYIEQIAEDPGEQQVVKQLSDVLGNVENHVKAFWQRNQQAAQEQQGQTGQDPQAAADAQATVIQAAAKSKIAEAMAAQKLQHKQEAFDQKQRQSAATTVHNATLTGARVAAENEALAARTEAQIRADAVRAASETNTQE